jgi:hypothetical protein
MDQWERTRDRDYINSGGLSSWQRALQRGHFTGRYDGYLGYMRVGPGDVILSTHASRGCGMNRRAVGKKTELLARKSLTKRR